MSNSGDGGTRALSGFLYQAIGALGMVAVDDCRGLAAYDPELTALLAVVKEGVAQFEAFDQDVAFRELGLDRRSCLLVQFKYSRLAPPRSIAPAELSEIVKSLKAGRERAEALGHADFGYALVTNRPLTDDSRQSLSTRPTKLSRSPARQIETEIREKLLVVSTGSVQLWETALERFAHSYGVEGSEYEGGVDTLIALLVRKSGQGLGPTIRKQDLVRAFTKHEDARELTSGAVVEVSRPSVSRFRNGLGLHGGEPVRRQVLRKISQAASEHALVVLSGLGGVGKTVALWQWEKAQVDAGDSGAFTEICRAREARRSWISDIVANWRGFPPSEGQPVDRPDRAVRRLLVANPDATRPILHVALDGLDEDMGRHGQEQNVREIVDWFWRQDEQTPHREGPPDATLLVTCRSMDDLIDRGFGLGVSGQPYEGEGPANVVVSDFSDDELLEAMDAVLPGLVERVRLAMASRSRTAEGISFRDQLVAFGATLSPVEAAHQEAVEAIAHPSMWQAFLTLEDDKKTQVLDGDPQALSGLGDAFARRFCRKAWDRGESSALREDDLLSVLRHIAQATKDQTPLRFAEWVSAATHDGNLKNPEARRLYYEAISGGLITQDEAQRWRWRHSLVWRYLAASGDSPPEDSTREGAL